MTTYVLRNGVVVEKGGPLDIREEKGNGPNVISDNMDALKNHATGKITDSKSEFRKMTKAAGCVEMGNDTLPPRKSVPLDSEKRREDIAKTIYDLKNQ